MNALEMLKEKNRLTKKCTILCSDCRLGPSWNEIECECLALERDYPEIYVSILKTWSEEYPKRTYLSRLLEIFPDARRDTDNLPRFCPTDLWAMKINKCDGDFSDSTLCEACWNQNYEE